MQGCDFDLTTPDGQQEYMRWVRAEADSSMKGLGMAILIALAMLVVGSVLIVAF